jgi:poly(3-hydroxybutyrate) depolymerase
MFKRLALIAAAPALGGIAAPAAHATPDECVTAGAPVVMMFHGSTGTGEQFLRTSAGASRQTRPG